MSEIKKNIETCRGEDVLAEVSGLPQDPHFGSLVNEALDPLKQQALHQAGYDGYSEVIEQHKPYTFASAIVQMKSNLLLLLRALWQFPFGSGTLRSLSDMWQHYITRLSGNETYGIPSRLSSLTDLPSAPLLLADRKISGANCQDGISFAHLACGDNSDVTELSDTNRGWTMVRSLPTMSGLKKLELGCEQIVGRFSIVSDDHTEEATIHAKHVEAGSGSYPPSFFTGTALKKINAPEMESFYIPGNDAGFVRYCANLEEINAPVLRDIRSGYVNTAFLCMDQLKLRKMVLGTITGNQAIMCGNSGAGSRPNLIHLELGAGTNVSLSSLQYWNPTNALDASLDTLVTDEDCHNNLEQFLKNFRTYIALRLTDNGSGKTLTLSQAVYDAIKDESHLFVFDEGTMTIYAYLTNIKHWTVTK